MRTTLRYQALRLRWALTDNRPAIVVFAILLVAAGAVSLGRTLSARQAPAIVIVNATPTLGTLPTPETATGLPRAAVAYAEPGGLVLGGLEPGRAYTVLARYGAQWLQIEAGSGAVWVLASEAGLMVDAALADLEPTAAPAVVYVREVQQQTVYVPVPAAPVVEPWQKPATGAAEAVVNRAPEAAARSEGAVFAAASVSAERQAGPAQCTNEGRACLGSKP